jgi:hypothetical protein
VIPPTAGPLLRAEIQRILLETVERLDADDSNFERAYLYAFMGASQAAERRAGDVGDVCASVAHWLVESFGGAREGAPALAHALSVLDAGSPSGAVGEELDDLLTGLAVGTVSASAFLRRTTLDRRV